MIPEPGQAAEIQEFLGRDRIGGLTAAEAEIRHLAADCEARRCPYKPEERLREAIRKLCLASYGP